LGGVGNIADRPVFLVNEGCQMRILPCFMTVSFFRPVTLSFMPYLRRVYGGVTPDFCSFGPITKKYYVANACNEALMTGVLLIDSRRRFICWSVPGYFHF
jgi:hypothetical protein